MRLENLLGIIAYKNVYPNDFSKLQLNKEMVYDIFAKKQDIINEKIRNIDEKCQEIREQIDAARKEHLENLSELQAAYILPLMSHPNNQLRIENANTIAQNEFWSQRTIIFNSASGGKKISLFHAGATWTHNYDFLTANGQKRDYREREATLLRGIEIFVEELKDQLEKLIKEKDTTKLLSLQELITQGAFQEIFSGDIGSEKLLIFLLRNGYIDEMYHYYITYFYPGTLTKEDLDFLISIKNQNSLLFDHPLKKRREIIQKLHGTEFKNVEILNYDLIEFIFLNANAFKTSFDSIVARLSNESQLSIEFIDGFINRGKNNELFLKLLCKNWPGMWLYLDSKSSFTHEKKNKYLIDIINFAEFNDIVALNIDHALTNYISRQNDFLKFVNELYIEKYRTVLFELDVKFTDLDIDPSIDSEMKMFNYVYENSLYLINPRMIEVILRILGKENPAEISAANYTSIQKSNCGQLIQYVEENIQEYIDNVFLELESNNKESEHSLLALLNNESISIQSRIKIIRKVDSVSNEINRVVNINLWQELISSEKVSASWTNILCYYQQKNMLDDTLAHFINIKCNELTDEQLSIDLETYRPIISAIIDCEKIEDNTFEYIKTIIPNDYFYPLPSENILSEKRIDCLLEFTLIDLTPESFMWLKEKYANKHLFLLVQQVESFLHKQSEFAWDANDIGIVLELVKIPRPPKDLLIQGLDIALFSDENKLAKPLCKYLLSSENENIKEDLLYKLLENNQISNDEQIQLLLMTKNLPTLMLNDVFEKMGKPYSEIIQRLKQQPLLVDNSLNHKLLTWVAHRGIISSFKTVRNGLRVYLKRS